VNALWEATDMARYNLGSWASGVAIGLLLGVLLGALVLHDVAIGAAMGFTLGLGCVAAGLAIQDGNRAAARLSSHQH
jgi:galactitol-specific phosphotransferase system IIC component